MAEPKKPRRNPRVQKSQGGFPGQGPGEGRPQLNNIDFITAVSKVNAPGVTPDMVRSIVRMGASQGLDPKEVIRFVQSRAFGSLGASPEALESVIEAIKADPQSLTTAVRLRLEGRRRPPGEEAGGLRERFQSTLFGLHPGLRDAYLTSQGASLDEEGNVLNAEGEIDEDLSGQFGAVRDDGPEPLTGDESPEFLYESVASMMQARTRSEQAQSYYGDYFSYNELLGEE